jgi:uncharacterized protein DUF5996
VSWLAVDALPLSMAKRERVDRRKRLRSKTADLREVIDKILAPAARFPGRDRNPFASRRPCAVREPADEGRAERSLRLPEGHMSRQWPALAYDTWKPTRDTLHAHTQVLGKLAVALAPPEPQLQHGALRLSARGWETPALPRPTARVR